MAANLARRRARAAEFDELTVEGLLREIVDKAIACDEISTKVEDGPNTLEEYDQLSSS
jgi:hypothetical protein